MNTLKQTLARAGIAGLLLASGTLVTLHFQGFFEASPRELFVVNYQCSEHRLSRREC